MSETTEVSYKRLVPLCNHKDYELKESQKKYVAKFYEYIIQKENHEATIRELRRAIGCSIEQIHCIITYLTYRDYLYEYTINKNDVVIGIAYGGVNKLW